MENLTKTDSLEYANRGIRVNAIAPGATMSTTGVAAAPMNQAWKHEDRKKAMSTTDYAYVESQIPMGVLVSLRRWQSQ